MGETLRLCQCRRCGLLQLDNAPVPYYKDVIRSGGFSKSMISSRNEQFKYFIDKCDLKGKKIVEVGLWGRGIYQGIEWVSCNGIWDRA